MEILTGIVTILNIVDLIFKVKDKVVSKTDKESLSNYLKSVGYLLKDVSIDMRNNHYPHQKCMELLTHLTNIEQVLNDKVSEEQLKNLKELIQQAYQVERLFGELQSLSVEEKNKNIEVVESAAGAFIATAEIVKI